MKPIYLDYNATTPTDPEVVQAMLPYFTEQFGNPANTLNSYGWSAESAVKNATSQVAELIGCRPSELVWNGGATEGNNSVVFGLITKLRSENPTEKIHLIASATEHLSVLNSFRAAQKFFNIEIDFVTVNKYGVVELSEIKKAIKPHTKLVSVMWVNNEIGSINPVESIAEFCQQNKIYFHTDATQAVGKIPVNLQNSAIHFLTFSAHKLYGPKGIGCLYTRSKDPYISIEPFLFGGGQQRNQRSGTLNVTAIVGAGKACEIAAKNLQIESQRTRMLIGILYEQLKGAIPELQLNGPGIKDRSPINLSLTFNKSVDLALPGLLGLAFSQGSACSTTEATMSHVLKAIGLSLSQAQNTMRFSVGRWTTESEIKQAAEILIKVFKS